MCIRWEPLARAGGGESPEPRNDRMLVPEAPMGLQRQRVDTVVGAVATLAVLQFSQKLRFQGPPRASGLQDFPGFSAQRNRLGESLRATRPRLLHVLGIITRVCDSETLWMGQWVPPIHRTPNKPRTGATQAALQTGTLKFLPDIPTEPPPHLEGTSRLC